MGQRELNRVIPANDRTTLDVKGDFIYLHTANLPLKVLVRGQMVTMREGDKRRVEQGFGRFYVENENGADVTAIFIVGTGDYSRASLVGEVAIQVSASLQSVADDTISTNSSKQILAANLTRKHVLLECDREVRIGDASVSATQGVRFASGKVHKVETTGPIYVRNDSGSDASISITEVLA